MHPESSNAGLAHGAVKRARGRPVVTAFKDPCLGAPLSGVLLLLPHEYVAGDATTTIKKKKYRTEQERTVCPVGYFPKKQWVFVVKETWYP